MLFVLEILERLDDTRELLHHLFMRTYDQSSTMSNVSRDLKAWLFLLRPMLANIYFNIYFNQLELKAIRSQLRCEAAKGRFFFVRFAEHFLVGVIGWP